ncbi:MAG: AAA family ATPase [Actinobacteria bacterium]|nr:AAA family ATPase [Actinomycetota bacterium]
MLTCASCGRESPDDFAFCPACASPLAPVSQPREVRKTVTVVFCDVTGSTSLGEKLDPESLRKVMARYFEEMRAVLERHGGTVEKFIGDAVMAVFGIPRLHEDDALRAVRAASDMRQALRLLNKELERDRGFTIAARIGVNTGEVVAGDPTAGQALVTGDAVNVAARLEQAARPGEVLIGEDTFRLVRDAVSAEPVQPLSVKGKGEPVAARRLLDVVPGAPGHARRLESPMVGRERQLGLLGQSFEAVSADRACQLFTVLGAPGVGKSRLVEEFLAGVGGEATVLRGRCLPYGEGITYFPVIEVLKQAAGLADFDLPEETERKICSVVEGEEHAGLVCSRVAQLFGLAEGVAVPEETFWAIRRFLEAVAAEGPLVLVFDDLHWGEPTFLDLVEHVADWSRDASILLLCMARPDLLDARPTWGGGKLNAVSVSLEPLSEGECERLVSNLLGATDIAEDVRARIAGAAEGNPLFVEEMLAMLIDDGLLVREDGRWGPSADLSEISVPPTISALLAARLDRLGPDERAVLERASVVGKVFFRGAVQELAPADARPQVSAHLMTLIRKELVRPDRSTLPGEDAFRFLHLLVRDAAYESMPKELRAELHERFAGWLEGVAGGRVAEQEEILGYHLEQAYRYRAELGPVDEHGRDLAVRAGRRLLEAGRRAFARGDMGGAANLLERAAALLPPTDPTRLDVLPDLGQALSEAGRLAEAERVLEEAVEAARGAGDRSLEARARLVWLGSSAGSLEEALDEAERALEVLEELRDDRGLAQAWHKIGLFRFWVGRSLAEEALERAIEHARAAGDRRTEAESLVELTILIWQGRIPAAEGLDRCRRILERAEGDRKAEAFALMVGAVLKARLGPFDEARAEIARGRAILQDLGLRVLAAATVMVSGEIEMLAGDAAAAERQLLQGYRVLEEVGERGYRSSVAARLAQALYLLGRYDEAERFAGASEEAAAPDDLEPQIILRSVRAKVLAGRAESDRARTMIDEAVEIASRTEWLVLRGDVLMDSSEVNRLTGRIAEAAADAEEALRQYEQAGSVVSAARARAVLGELTR